MSNWELATSHEATSGSSKSEEVDKFPRPMGAVVWDGEGRSDVAIRCKLRPEAVQAVNYPNLYQWHHVWCFYKRLIGGRFSFLLYSTGPFFFLSQESQAESELVNGLTLAASFSDNLNNATFTVVNPGWKNSCARACDSCFFFLFFFTFSLLSKCSNLTLSSPIVFHNHSNLRNKSDDSTADIAEMKLWLFPKWAFVCYCVLQLNHIKSILWQPWISLFFKHIKIVQRRFIDTDIIKNSWSRLFIPQETEVFFFISHQRKPPECLSLSPPPPPPQVTARAEHLGSGLLHQGCQPNPNQFIGVFAQNRPEVKLLARLCCFSRSSLSCITTTLGSDELNTAAFICTDRWCKHTNTNTHTHLDFSLLRK